MKRSLKLLSLLSAAVVSMTMCLSACGEEKVAEHDHVWNAGEVTTEPTCMEDGVKTYTCTVEGCGQTKTENLGKAPHTWDEGEVTVQPTCIKEGEKTFKCKVEGCKGTKTEPIDKVAHTWGEAVVTTPATFTQPGVKTKTCTVEGCGATDTEAIAAQADFGMQFSTDPTTVETSGWSYMYYNSFDFNTDPSGWGMGADFTADAENNVWKAAGVQLSKDGFSLDGGKTVAVGFMKEAMPHAEANVEFKFATQNDGVKVYVNANEEKIYSNDNNEKSVDFTSEDPTDLGETAHTFVVVIQNTGTEKAEGSFAFTVKPVCLHAWNEGTVKTAATCKAAGEREFTCAVCGDTYTETIPQTDHKIEITIDRPTFTHEGNIHEECAVCGEQQKDTPLPKQVNFEYDFAIADSGEFNGWQVGRVDYDFPTETFEFTPITEHSDEAYKDNTNGWKEIKNNWMAANGMMGFAYKFPADAPAKVDFHFVLNAVGDAQFTIRWAVKNSDGDIKTNDGKASFVGDANRAAYDFTEAVDVVANDVLYILVNKEGDTGDQCNFKLVLTEAFAGANFTEDFHGDDVTDSAWEYGSSVYSWDSNNDIKVGGESFTYTKGTYNSDSQSWNGSENVEIKNNHINFAGGNATIVYTVPVDFKADITLDFAGEDSTTKSVVRAVWTNSENVLKEKWETFDVHSNTQQSWTAEFKDKDLKSGDKIYFIFFSEGGTAAGTINALTIMPATTQPPVTEQEIANYHDDFKLDDSGNWVYGYATDYDWDTNGFTFNTDLTANSGEGQWNTSDNKIKIKNDYFESDDGKNVTVGYKVQPGQTPNKITVTFNGSDNPEANPRYAIRVVIKGSDGNVKSCKIDDSGATQATWSYTADDITAGEGDTIYVVFFHKNGWQQGKFQITISQA